jgi:hypothetical protein
MAAETLNVFIECNDLIIKINYEMNTDDTVLDLKRAIAQVNRN